MNIAALKKLRPLDRLGYFVPEREAIRERKERGDPAPWTDDEILREWKFCNVRREDDRVTRWLRTNWREPYAKHPDLWHGLLVGRQISWPDTLAECGWPERWPEKREAFLATMRAREARGDKVYTGAFIVSNNGVPGSKIDVVAGLFDRAWAMKDPPRTGDSLRDAYGKFMALFGVSSFMAAQFVADLKYTPILRKAKDWWVWAAPGDGSMRGLNRLQGLPLNKKWRDDAFLAVLMELRPRLAKLAPIAGELCLQDIQNCLCEFDKFERELHGEGHPRARYVPYVPATQAPKGTAPTAKRKAKPKRPKPTPKPVPAGDKADAESAKTSTPSSHDFLAVVFANRTGEIWTTAFPGDPNSNKSAWAGRIYEPAHNVATDENWYFAISELRPGTTQRQVKNFHALRVVVLDDIGTKVDPKKISLRPTYRIETSPGNEQWGFLLDAPLTDKTKANRLLDVVKSAGATDVGGMNLLRAVRLPGGINGKAKYGTPSPRVALREWEPDRRYTPEAIAAAFGATLDGQRGRPRKDLPPLAPDADPILKLLAELGMVRNPAPNARGFADITCPWGDGHTDKDTSAGYAPGGGFSCFHAHCADRRIDDLLAWLREQGCAVDEAIAAMPGARGGLLRALLRYVFVRDVDAFVDCEQGTFVQATALDRYLANEMPRFKPTNVMLEHDDLQRVLAAVYLPGQQEIIEMNESGRPILAANTWRAGPIGVAATGDVAAIEPYLNHLRWLFPEPVEQRIVLDFLTHVVQRRGTKINWMLVALATMQGAGRDTLLKPIRDILGRLNVVTIGAEELFSAFNAWELSELVCFSEADSPEHSRWKVYRALKSKVVRPPDTANINVKFIPAREQIKIANYVMFTNDPGAVAVDRGDRRVCVVETPHTFDAVLRYTNTGVFKRLHAMYTDSGWMERFHRFLLDRTISADFDAAGRAPATPASARMFSASRSGLEVFVEESIEEKRGAFAADLAKLATLLPLVHQSPGLGSTTVNALATALRRAGCVCLPDFKGTNRKNVKGVWALRQVDMYLAMSPVALREVWAGNRRMQVPKAAKAAKF